MGITDISKVNSADDLRREEPTTSDIPDYFDDPAEIQCLHCGEIQHHESGDPGMYTEDGTVHRCGECKKVYTIYGSMSWSWSTEANSDA